MAKQSDQFKKLVKFFRELNYKIETKFVWKSLKHPYWFAKITGRSIFGGFCEPVEDTLDCNWFVNGRIAFDHVKCFDKWSKCPYSLELPLIMQELKYVVDQMKFLRTKEGFKKSNEFELWVRDYPFSTHVLCPNCNGMKRVSGKRTKKIEFKNGQPPMYVGNSIKCPKCKGTGKVKRIYGK
jgi:hypothetical protein